MKEWRIHCNKTYRCSCLWRTMSCPEFVI